MLDTDHRTEDRIAGRFEAIMSHLPGLLYRCDSTEGYPLSWIGGQVRELTEYTPRELVENRHGEWSDLFHEEDFEAAAAEVQRAVAERRPWQVSLRLRSKSGRVRWVQGFGAAVHRDGAGEPEALEGVMIDVTRHAEAKLDWQRAAEVAQARNAKIVAATADMLETLQSLSVLSINASIEAARAGENGRGFNVVAQEMNRLAARAEDTATAIRKATDGSGHVETGALRSRVGNGSLAQRQQPDGPAEHEAMPSHDTAPAD
ncbi:PAS domain-containing protein [Roseobacter sp. HKCCA0434]|uniref:methyl-accepting chemotaxis protein n=1 Tax=Roseobacter sp. HKCCA0434 TaxID=3079297 RepID=UPI002905986B|nr:PAS domain-containing protein [Roseobacter sp. HKCCA0434]